MWEEPCISGSKGAGTVFFSGCNLRCVYCQNKEISRKPTGNRVSSGRLKEIFFELRDMGAVNIDLVTADIYLPSVREAVEAARREGLGLPFLLNTSSYVTVESLKSLEGLIDIYLPDFKYFHEADAQRYSGAGDYPTVARLAIAEMVRQRPECVFSENGNGERLLKSGVLVRHLLLPGKLIAAKQTVKYLHENYGERIWISLLNQYTPNGELAGFPEIDRRLFGREYKSLVDHAVSLGIQNAYVQSGEAADEVYIPAFDGRGTQSCAKPHNAV